MSRESVFATNRKMPCVSDNVLRCGVETQSSWSGFALTREAWRLPLRRHDPLLRNWLERKAAQILSRQAGKEGVAMDGSASVGYTGERKRHGH